MIIPDSVITIGTGAFEGCEGLLSLTLGKSVKEIGDYAFANLYSLANLEIRSESISDLGEENNVFFSLGRDSHLRVSIKDTVSYIPAYLFRPTERIPNSANIYSLVFDERKEDISIGDYAFANSYIKNIVFPEGLVSIGKNAFENSKKLVSVTFTSSPEVIKQNAFLNCSGITIVDVYDINGWCSVDFESRESNPIYYANTLLVNSESKKDLVLESNESGIISRYAFIGCENIRTVHIGKNITEIGEYAFFGCSAITNLTLESSLQAIGTSAFEGCTKLVEVYNLSHINIKYDNNSCISDYALNIYSDTNGVKKTYTDQNGLVFYESDGISFLIDYVGESSEIILPVYSNTCKYIVRKDAFNNSVKIESIYFFGTATEWNSLVIEEGNAALKTAKTYFYSYEEPTSESLQKLSWYYDEKGNPVPWKTN